MNVILYSAKCRTYQDLGSSTMPVPNYTSLLCPDCTTHMLSMYNWVQIGDKEWNTACCFSIFMHIAVYTETMHN